MKYLRLIIGLTLIFGILLVPAIVQASGGYIGFTSGSATYDEPANSLQSMRIQNTIGNGILTSIKFELNTASPSGSIRMGIYADSSGSPGNLLVDAGEIAVINGWTEISGLSLTVTNGAWYWLSYVMSHNNFVVYGYSGIPDDGCHTKCTQTYGPLPSTFPDSSWRNGWQYHVQAYINMTTAPTVTTSAASGVTSANATLNGDVTATGGENPTVTVYWGTSDGGTNPASWSNNSSPTSPSQPQGVAAFTKSLTSLSPNTLYYFSAEGTNSGGTGWGSSQNFTTSVAIPAVTTSAASSITSTSATLNGNVTDTGGENPTVTVYWGTSDGGTTPASWSDNSSPTSPSQPQGIASFIKNLTGLTPGTLYYFNAKDTNSGGTGWGSSQNFTAGISAPTITMSAASGITTTDSTLNGNVTATGGENPTVTVYWGGSDGGTNPAAWSNNSSPTSPAQPQGIAAFTKNLTGLSPNTLYYFNAKATNSGGTGWGTSLDFSTDVASPAVTNGIGATNITINSARLNGNVTDTGGENPNAVVYWGLTDGGTTPTLWSDNYSLGVEPLGAFHHDVIGSLSPSTLYYYRMRVTNSASTAWAGSSENFTTSIVGISISAPTDFILTDLGAITINAAWVKGGGSTYSMLRVSRTDFPATVTDGELVYYGENVTDNTSGYSLDTNTYFFVYGRLIRTMLPIQAHRLMPALEAKE
jgi:hypothetical protein